MAAPSPVPSFGCTCARLRKLARRVTRLYDTHLAGLGIKFTQYSLLANVAARARSVSELAAQMDMERTTLSRNLAPLVVQGWVRIDVGADPRSRVVSITAAGKRKLAAALPLWRKAQHQTESILGSAAVGELHRRIERALAALPAVTPEGKHS